MKNPLPLNDREKDLAQFWTDQGLNHTEPSKKTLEIFKAMGEEIKKIEIKMTEHGIRIENIIDGISEIKEAVKDINECYVKKVEFSDHRSEYDKKIEKISSNLSWALKLSITTMLSMIAFLVTQFIDIIQK